MEALYTAAPPIPSSDDEDWFEEPNEGFSSAGEHSGSDGSTSEESFDEEELYDPEVVQKKLEHRVRWADELLQRLSDLANQYNEVDEKGEMKCSVVGIGKLKNKIQKEKNNSQRYWEELLEGEERGDPPERIDSIVTKAVLLLRCSSLTHLSTVLYCAEREPKVTGVSVVVPSVGEGGRTHALEIDVVSCGGLRWIKIRTSTRRNLEREMSEQGSSSYVHQLRELAARAEATKCAFQFHPQVSVVFTNTPPPVLVSVLEKRNMTVSVLNTSEEKGERKPIFPPLSLFPHFICFDTTALVALCSESCFLETDYLDLFYQRVSKFKVLTEQIKREQVDHAVTTYIDPHLRSFTRFIEPREMEKTLRELPLNSTEGGLSEEEAEWRRRYAPVEVLHPDLQWLEDLQEEWAALDKKEFEFLQSECVEQVDTDRRAQTGKITNWVIADITYHEFKWMIETLAGPYEVRRAALLLKNISVVSTEFLRKSPFRGTDGLVPSGGLLTPAQTLKVTSKVSLRNKIIFGAADVIHAVMITSNRQVQNAAREQHIFFYALPHPTRSLTEQKLKCLPRRPGPTKPPPFDYDG